MEHIPQIVFLGAVAFLATVFFTAWLILLTSVYDHYKWKKRNRVLNKRPSMPPRRK